MLDIREMVRRFRLGEGDRRIARDLDASRNTVKKYRDWAKQKGFLDGCELPPPSVIDEQYRTSLPPPTPGPASAAEPFRAFVIEKRGQGVEIKALLGLLREHGFTGSYPALRRFVVRVEAKQPQTFIRVETPPGEEAQVDFGYVGEIPDPPLEKPHKAWVFVMTLSHSRHHYAEIVFNQKVETWCELHVRAFEFFGGVVKRVVIDNLKAAIVRAVIHDAEAQRSYRELAEHYGFLISPCRPRTPRHKGKVESGVHYVNRNALAGRTFTGRDEANAHLMRWNREVAGVRDHGTTHEAPLARFEKERPVLQPLPATRYEVTVWKEVKLHPDCHVVFEYSYYSAPFRLVGQKLWLRAMPQRIELYYNHDLLATHPRACDRGMRVTHNDHLPPEKIQGLLGLPRYVREQAALIGPFTAELVERLLGERPVDRLRTAQAILQFAKRVSRERLEAACKRALSFNEVGYQSIKRILAKGLENKPMEDPSKAGPLPKTSVFARPASELFPRNPN